MNKCFECEATKDLQKHHPVPKSRGGRKTVTLCYQCHMKAHGRDAKGLNHKKLTKEGLASAKERGVKLGNRTNMKEAQALGRKANAEKADRFCMKLAPIVMNDMNHSAMARQLNELEIKTITGKEWSSKQVNQLRKRIKKIKEER